ncbi:acyl carrier protein [Chryseobacterium phosphatilyticum]|uniref:Acyl carrier protein n=1 Tax=Chryseobacterium phosphatilyticum TaxID=475075 RepID=A0A316XHY8_9FLAO|nr:acyl carrier protein [Chryseobacterium phosphatilyticum]PWN71783.1 acyl carrier protein [Chryseobacterium phosphatilyticum]
MQNQEKLFEKVYEILADITECNPKEIQPDTNLMREMGMTSLMGLEVLVELERNFQISLDEELLVNMTTPKDIIKVLQEELAN